MRRLYILLTLAMTMTWVPSEALAQSICTIGKHPTRNFGWNATHIVRLPKDFKKNFGAAIDTDFVPRTPDEIEEISNNLVSNHLSSLERANTFVLWTDLPPYFDFRAEGKAFEILIERKTGSEILFKSERMMDQTELTFVFDYFLTRSLGRCNADRGDASFASLHYKLAAFRLEHWCQGDGEWFKSKICTEKPLRDETERFETAFEKVSSLVVDNIQDMDATEAQLVPIYLEEWSEYIAQLKERWCRTYRETGASCLD